MDLDLRALDMAPALLLANWIDSLHIEIPDKYVCALTPMWILGVGAAVGLILCFVIWLLMAGLSRIPGLGDLATNKSTARLVAAVLAVLIFTGTLVWWFQSPEAKVAADAVAKAPANPAAEDAKKPGIS